MKIRPFLWAATLAAVGAISGMAWAQDTDTAPVGTGAPAESGTGAGAGGRLNFLSADDRQHLMRDRRQALADNPDLKTEQETLKQQWQSAKSGTGDKKAMRQQMMDFHEKMNAAMLKEDPSIQPVLDQLKAHMKERFQQRAGGTGAAGTADDNSGNQ